ncbi:MAG: Hsp70 family protein [Micrococcales bacterium]|nr:Hsp70 family protein [Micrococcales bacterium]
MGWVLAVDFGSVNTAAAWASEGRIEKIRLEPSSETMPSAVVWVDGHWRVGQSALNARRANPTTFVATPKARLGYEPTLLGSMMVRASTMVAQVFTVVRDRALAAAGGTEPERLILTHPEHWGPKRQAALLKAARTAGFPNEMTTLLPEPVAAVRAHTEPASLTIGSRVAVVDIGGGTCDVAILERVLDNGLMVVAREGDERLGGNDFDDLLYQWLLDQLGASGHDDMVTILQDPANVGSALTVLESVRLAKQDLSEHPDAQITVSVAADNETTVTVTRDEYEQIIDEPLRRLAGLVRSAMISSGTKKLTHLFLTGGSTHTPAVARVLHEVTGILSAPLGDPKTATVTGALRTVLHAVPRPTSALSILPSVPPPPPGGSAFATETNGLVAALGALLGAQAAEAAGLNPTGQTDTQTSPDVTGEANPPDGPANQVPQAPVTSSNPSKHWPRRRTIALVAAVPAVVALVVGGWLGTAYGSKDGPFTPKTVAGADGSDGTGLDGSPGSSPDDVGPGSGLGAESERGTGSDGTVVIDPITGEVIELPPSDDPANGNTPTSTPTSKPAVENTPKTLPVMLAIDGDYRQDSMTRECSEGAWFNSPSETIGKTSYKTAIGCVMWNNADFTPSVVYSVPSGATRFTATVGIADGTAKEGDIVRFAVYDTGSTTPLWEKNVTPGKVFSVDISVNSVSKVRLEVRRVGEITTYTRAVWASPKFS